MKRIIALLLLTTLVLSLVGCGSDTDPDVTTEPPAQTNDPTPKEDPAVDQTDYAATVKMRLNQAQAGPTSAFGYVLAGDGVTLTSYSGSEIHLRVPDRIGLLPVTGIADGAFKDQTAIKTIVLPDSVKTIGTGILEGCTALETIHIPLLADRAESTAQSIGYLFGTDNVRIPASLIYVSLGGNVSSVAARAFAECSGLVAVLLGDSVRAVGDFAFHGCDKLKYVNLDQLQSVGAYAFGDCRVLVRADLSAMLQSVGVGAFQGCSALSSMKLPFVGGTRSENTYLGYIFGANTTDFTAGFIPAYLRRIEILDGCTALGNYAFFECSSLREIKLSATLQSIGVRAFEGCTELRALTLPDRLTTIRENAFVGCTSLATLTFGAGLTSIGINAFYHCTALQSITLPASLTALPASAFANCKALTHVDLGGVTSVGKNAFHGCSSIQAVHTEKAVNLADGNDALRNILDAE